MTCKERSINGFQYHWKRHRKGFPIYPLHDVFVRKAKVLKKPRFELEKLTELHGESS